MESKTIEKNRCTIAIQSMEHTAIDNLLGWIRLTIKAYNPGHVL